MTNSEHSKEFASRKVLALVRERGIVRPRDISALGLSPTHLQRLYEQGRIDRSGRGIYIASEAELSFRATLAEAAIRAPRGVVCLISALEFHGLTTQLPDRVWMALPTGARHPKSDWPPIRCVTMSGVTYELGVETHRIDGVEVPVFSAVKTVVDCFRFRNRVGLDVAMEAIRDFRRYGKGTMSEIWDAAVACRVSCSMKPYLEALA